MDTVTWSALRQALATLKTSRPGDRSEKDRRYAVAITEMEKVAAYFYLFVMAEPLTEEVNIKE